MEQPIRVLIADDHPIVREGLAKTIASHSAFTLVGQASDGAEALALLRQHHPDLSLLDVEMPKLSGIDIARTVHKEGLPTDIVLLTMHKEAVYFNSAMDLGVRGYLLKDSVIGELVQCITTVGHGDYYISPAMSHLLVERKKQLATIPRTATPVTMLTPAERTILRLLAENLTSREIADRLSVSARTVENHRLRMRQKLEITAHNGLLQFALEHQHEI